MYGLLWNFHEVFLEFHAMTLCEIGHVLSKGIQWNTVFFFLPEWELVCERVFMFCLGFLWRDAMWFLEFDCDVMDWHFGDAVECHGKEFLDISWNYMSWVFGVWDGVSWDEIHGMSSETLHCRWQETSWEWKNDVKHWQNIAATLPHITWIWEECYYCIYSTSVLQKHCISIALLMKKWTITRKGIKKPWLSPKRSRVPKSTTLPRVRLELTTFRLWDWRAA